VKLTKAQYQLVLYFEQYYWRKGKLPSYNEALADGLNACKPALGEKWWEVTCSAPMFRGALVARGVPEHQFNHWGVTEGLEATALSGLLEPNLAAYVLSEQQMVVANAMIDVLDRRSRIKKLTENNVSTTEFNSWLKQSAYKKYCLDRTEGLLEENQHVAHLSLIDRVTQGDLGAIKYFNSMTGRFREKASAAVEVNVQNNYGSDTLIAIVEIIQRHVKDPDVLEAIGAEVLALQRGETRAVGNTNGPVGSPVGSPVGALSYRQQELISGKVV
jgi:hypothetical protein